MRYYFVAGIAKTYMKIKRNIKTFEADEDVAQMINAAQEAGLSLVAIVNEALREYGKPIIASLVNKRTKALRKLSSRSFNNPDPQQGGMLMAA